MDTTQTTFFDGGATIDMLCDNKDPLLRFSECAALEELTKEADHIWRVENAARSNRGRKPWPSAIMLRILLLKFLYNISDEQTEHLLKDRLSFKRFVGLGLLDEVPDCNTIRNYTEALSKENSEGKDGARRLFEIFKSRLKHYGLLVEEGKIVDATFTTVPIQRNTSEENDEIKSGKTPDAWKKQPNKLRHKDTDARWVKKGEVNYYGYKDHIKSGARTKFIHDYVVTAASVHDSQVLDKLLESSDIRVHGDGAYFGDPIAQFLESIGVENRIHEKGFAKHPLSKEQREKNREKSRIRARVEHIFGHMTNSMGGIINRCIGMARNRCAIGMRNLCYNICRCGQLLSMPGEVRFNLLHPSGVITRYFVG